MAVIAVAPVRRQLVGRRRQLAHDRVGDERQQLVLRADVVVERHRPGVELGREAAHRQRVDALGVGDAHRGRGDLLAGEARAPARPRSGRVPDVERLGHRRATISRRLGLSRPVGRDPFALAMCTVYC